MGYGTWPTIDGCVNHVRAMMTVDGGECLGTDHDDPCVPGVIGMVPVPDGLVLGWENCRTCGESGVYHDSACQGECSDGRPWDGWCGTCPHCFGAARFPVWLRECDRCGREGRILCECADHVPGDYGCKIARCPNGCVEVDGRWMIPVRNGGQT